MDLRKLAGLEELGITLPPGPCTSLAQDLEAAALNTPHKKAIACAVGQDDNGRLTYSTYTFSQLVDECNRYARGLLKVGIGKDTRVLIMLRPGLDFAAVIFALLKVGAVPVLIDPGMGLRRLVACIAESAPQAMIGIPKAHVLRMLFAKYFRSVRVKVTTAKKPWTSAIPLHELREPTNEPYVEPKFDPNELGAILFTSGSTGIPKGVELQRRHMSTQKSAWNEAFALTADDVDLVTFPIFLLVGLASGRSCVIPPMDFSRPAHASSQSLVQAVDDHGASVCFGSPVLWNNLTRHCRRQKLALPSLRKIVSAGAPVPVSVLKRFEDIAPDATVYTPFGATEALPITNISANEILGDTAAFSADGHGTCVGQPTPGVVIRIIKISDDVIPEWSNEILAANGEVGEIVVKGDVVTEGYFRRDPQTRLAKIYGMDRHTGKPVVWHRMGDLGYFDKKGRLWFCGRKVHQTFYGGRPYFSVKIEGIFNALDEIWRSALVNVTRRGQPELALVFELEPDAQIPDMHAYGERLRRVAEQHHVPIAHFLRYPKAFPVDRRHNAKIERHVLARWAQKQVGRT